MENMNRLKNKKIGEISRKIEQYWHWLRSREDFAKNSLIMVILFFLSAVTLMVSIIYSKVIPTVYILIILFSLYLIGALTSFILFMRRTPRRTKIFFQIFSGILSVVMLVGAFYVNAFGNIFRQVQVDNPETIHYSVFVKKESKLQGLGWLGLANIGMLSSENNRKAGEFLYDNIESSSGVVGKVNIKYYDNLYELAEKFLAGSDQLLALCLDQAHIQLLADGIEGFEDQVKDVANFGIENSEGMDMGKPIKSEDGSFVIYLSVIDQYDLKDSIELTKWGKRGSELLLDDVRGKSEINRLLVVNQDQRKILIIDMPTNYYVQTSNTEEMMDQISNAGVGGIQDSIDAIEKLYGVDVNYFIRATYKDIADLIDEIGGIDIYLDSSIQGYPKIEFSAQRGMNHFNGAQAIAFARSYSMGDENINNNVGGQEQIVDGIVEKLNHSSNILWQNFNPILTVSGRTFKTNIPSDLMTNIVKSQILEGASWSVEKYKVTGSGADRTIGSLKSDEITYHVIIPDEAVILEAKEKIQNILNGR